MTRSRRLLHTRWHTPQLVVLLAAVLACPACVDLSQAAGAQNMQSVLCSTSCSSHAHARVRRCSFLTFARQQLLRPLASLALPLRPIPASLLVYLSALRGMRGGATAVHMAPSTFSRLGLSDLGQTSTAAPEREYRATSHTVPQARSTSTSVEELHNMKLMALQRACKARGLNSRGLKSDLVDRLLQHLADNPGLPLDAADSATSGKRHQRDDQDEGLGRAGPDDTKKRLLRRPRKPTESLEILREIETVLDADYIFEVFPTQAEAFKFADARPGLGIQVFSQDKCSTGAKSYVAATTKGFWSMYLKLAPVERHFGEIIREGTPCRVYFDVEFRIGDDDVVAESHALGSQRVDILLRALHVELAKEYPEQYAKVGPMQVVELDSSSPIKFSRHLIVPNVAFKDNIHAGAFVKRFVETLPSDVGECVDLGVYTRNRCFRIVHSSKFGKNTTFEYSAREYPFKWTDVKSNAFMKVRSLSEGHAAAERFSAQHARYIGQYTRRHNTTGKKNSIEKVL